jgi:hypothetical protein
MEGTWQDVIGWTWDDNGFWFRVRISQNGTIAVWKRFDAEDATGVLFYELVNWTRDGQVLGPVTNRKANNCRELMSKLRREAA